jgi:hypothetical protein
MEFNWVSVLLFLAVLCFVTVVVTGGYYLGRWVAGGSTISKVVTISITVVVLVWIVLFLGLSHAE